MSLANLLSKLEKSMTAQRRRHRTLNASGVNKQQRNPTDMKQSLAATLHNLPAETTPTFLTWLNGRDVMVKLSRSRKTKRGDFTATGGGRAPVITVNRDLGSYSLAVTLTHEIAHFFTWERHKRSVKPHGPEWKRCFGEMLNELAQVNSLPEEFKIAIRSHAEKPKASSFRDLNLYRTLCKLDGTDDVWLENLNDGDEFFLKGKKFRRERKRRTRCLCVEVATGRKYLVSLAASISLSG